MKPELFSNAHLSQIDAYDRQEVDSADYEKSSSAALTYREGDTVLFCIGITPGRVIWMFMSRHTSKHMLKITRTVKRLMRDVAGPGALYCQVRNDFPEAVRWMNLLGFVPSGPVGSDWTLYHKEN